jgi:TolA-binding protein
VRRNPTPAAPIAYRSSRRVLRRLVIPGALAAIVAGAAIGAAASYLTSQGSPAAQRQPGTHTAPAGHAQPATRPATTAGAPPTTASTSTSPGATTPGAPSSADVAEGRLLNDEGYARMRQGDYDGAVPPLRRAVADLRGAGPGDPYEAYANYNLGYTLLQVGDCTGAVPPLEVANRLESSPLVDAAIRRASACAHQGS